MASKGSENCIPISRARLDPLDPEPTTRTTTRRSTRGGAREEEHDHEHENEHEHEEDHEEEQWDNDAKQIPGQGTKVRKANLADPSGWSY